MKFLRDFTISTEAKYGTVRCNTVRLPITDTHTSTRCWSHELLLLQSQDVMYIMHMISYKWCNGVTFHRHQHHRTIIITKWTQVHLSLNWSQNDCQTTYKARLEKWSEKVFNWRLQKSFKSWSAGRTEKCPYTYYTACRRRNETNPLVFTRATLC